MLITIVAIEASPRANASSLRRVFSMAAFLRGPVEDVSSSEVIRSMRAMTASQRPMSENEKNDNGKFKFSSFPISVINFDIY